MVCKSAEQRLKMLRFWERYGLLATSLTMRPVFPSFLYFISHTPCAGSRRHQIHDVRILPSGRHLARDVVSDPRLAQSERPQSFLRYPIGVGHPLVLTDVLEPRIQ